MVEIVTPIFAQSSKPFFRPWVFGKFLRLVLTLQSIQCKVESRYNIVEWVPNKMNSTRHQVCAVSVHHLTPLTRYSIFGYVVSFHASSREDLLILDVTHRTTHITSTATVCFGQEIAPFWTRLNVHWCSPEWTSGTVFEYSLACSVLPYVFPSIIRSRILPRDCPYKERCVRCSRIL
jgi:hypothetical protein